MKNIVRKGGLGHQGNTQLHGHIRAGSGDSDSELLTSFTKTGFK